MKRNNFGLSRARMMLVPNQFIFCQMDEAAADDVIVHPNSTKDFLNIQLLLGSAVELLNPLGQAILNLEVEHERLNFNLSNLLAAAYGVRVQKDHQVITKRVIKE